MTSTIVTVVLVSSVAAILIACQLLCWFTEPRIILGMGRALPTVTIAIAWLTLVVYGVIRLVGASSHAGAMSRSLFAGAFHFVVVGVPCSVVFLVVECVLLIECGLTRDRSGTVWWHLGGATSTALSLYALSLFDQSG
jgi:hypothetical protein